jgi:uncharacterized protein YhaN
MKLLRCHINGFGKLAGLPLTFGDGLNVVCAVNEAGKTTLQRFLVGMLYGQLLPQFTTRRYFDDWVAHYRPWSGAEYGGILWCRLASGRELELRRTLGRENSSLVIRTSTGEDITSEYDQQRNGDVLFARTVLGLPKELFEPVAAIGKMNVSSFSEREKPPILDRIANLAQSGDEELSIQQSVAKLEDALKAIGSEQAPTRPFRQTLDLIDALRTERNLLEQRRVEFQIWVDERARLAADTARLESELSIAHRMVVSARLRETAEKVRELEQLDAEIQVLSRDIEAVGGNAAFPAHRLDALNHLAAVRQGFWSQLGGAQNDTAEASAAEVSAAKELREFAGYDPIDAEAEKNIADWFVGYLSLSIQKDNAQRTAAELKETIADLNRTLAARPALSSGFAWERLEREAAEEERTATARVSELGSRINALYVPLEAARKAAARARAAAIGAFVLGCGVAGLVLGSSLLPRVAAFSGAGLMLVIAAVMLALSSRSRRACSAKETEIARLKAEQARTREDGRRLYAEISRAMAECGFTEIEDFLAEAKKFDSIRQRIRDLTERAGAAQEQRERIEGESAELFGRIRAALAKVSLSCSPGNLKFQIDVLRANLRQFRDVHARWNVATENLRAARAREEQLGGDLARCDSDISAILAEGESASVEEFREACRRRQRLLELLDRKAARVREYASLRGAVTLAEWRAQLEHLEELNRQQGVRERSVQGAAAATAVAGKAMPLLPYSPTSDEAEQDEKRIAALLAMTREEYVRISERVAQAFEHFRSLSEIDEDLETVVQTLAALRANRDALTLAADLLRALSREQQEILAPQLNRAVEQRFLRLSRSRYDEVRIDPALKVIARETGGVELRELEQLSHGTQDQLYLALRFAILDLVGSDQESCPCFLDEPLAAYDKVRMAEALQLLTEEAERRQVFLFTCREDLCELIGAEQRGHIIRLAGPE